MRQPNSPTHPEDDVIPHISQDIPEATRHDFQLADERNLSYYTFETGPSKEKNPTPVFYFHGFPGCGLEGAVCANEVAKAGGKLYAPDRPGFGHSDSYDSSLTDVDEQVQAFVNDLWEFITHEKWKSFSIIAVSGGGPFALAFLTSFLEKRADSQDTTPFPKLETMSLVAAVCCSAGAEGMMKTNETLMNIVENQDKMLYRLALNLMFAVSFFMVKILPSNWLLKMTPTKDLPVPDQEVLSNLQVSKHMMRVLSLALGQSYTAAVNEARIIFRLKQGFENSLVYRYEQPTKDYPQITIYQGGLDVNVPKSHARFMQEKLLHGTPNFVEYPELGHLSLVVSKAQEYSQFALGH